MVDIFSGESEGYNNELNIVIGNTFKDAAERGIVGTDDGENEG